MMHQSSVAKLAVAAVSFDTRVTPVTVEPENSVNFDDRGAVNYLPILLQDIMQSTSKC